MNTYQHAQLAALGDATRRAILARLVDGAMSVGTLADEFPVSRPAISQHLRILKDAELVTDRADGTRRYYQLNPAGFVALREYADQFWTRALLAFKEKVEEEECQPRPSSSPSSSPSPSKRASSARSKSSQRKSTRGGRAATTSAKSR